MAGIVLMKATHSANARFFGNWHKVYTMKHALRNRWLISTGGMYVATHAGHRSKIAGHTIVTQRNVYATGVLARSMKAWVDLIGSKMILKRRKLDMKLANLSGAQETVSIRTNYSPLSSDDFDLASEYGRETATTP